MSTACITVRSPSTNLVLPIEHGHLPLRLVAVVEPHQRALLDAIDVGDGRLCVRSRTSIQATVTNRVKRPLLEDISQQSQLGPKRKIRLQGSAPGIPPSTKAMLDAEVERDHQTTRASAVP